MGHRGNTSSILAAVALLMAVVAVACSGSGDDEGDDADGGERAAAESADPAPPLPRLHAVRGERPGIFDEDGRQVVLRGVNLNFLAEYARNNPDHEPTLPLDGHTWNQIANEGMNVVRLLVSWSRLQPDDAGSIDGGYVDQIEQAVADAAHHGSTW